jgi:hypothetical protein
MIARLATVHAALALVLPIAIAPTGASASSTAADSCAAGLPRDAKAIFEATLPQVARGSDLRALVTTNTRSLAMSGAIDRGTARQSATAAAQCLQRADN